MAVQQNVARVHRRQMLQIHDVPVRGENGPPAGAQQAVSGADGKIQHHLIHFAVAVALYAQNIGAVRVEQRRRTRRIIPFGQGVARAMIKNIAQKMCIRDRSTMGP